MKDLHNIKCVDYDEKNFEEVVKENEGLIRSIIGTFDLEYGHYMVSKDDMYQEGLIALYDAYINYDKQKDVKFSTYAYVLIKRAIRKCYQSHINKYKHESFSIDTIDLVDHSAIISDCSVSDSVMDNIKADEIRNKIDRQFKILKQEDQKIVALRALNNTYEQIADKLNITSKKVDNRLFRIKERFLKNNIYAEVIG